MDFSTSPWVSGTRALGYYGPVKSSQFSVMRDGTLNPDFDDLLEMLGTEAEKASDGLANFVVGVEFDVDPFPNDAPAGSVLMKACGTASRLSSAWE